MLTLPVVSWQVQGVYRSMPDGPSFSLAHSLSHSYLLLRRLPRDCFPQTSHSLPPSHFPLISHLLARSSSFITPDLTKTKTPEEKRLHEDTSRRLTNTRSVVISFFTGLGTSLSRFRPRSPLKTDEAQHCPTTLPHALLLTRWKEGSNCGRASPRAGFGVLTAMFRRSSPKRVEVGGATREGHREETKRCADRDQLSFFFACLLSTAFASPKLCILGCADCVGSCGLLPTPRRHMWGLVIALQCG